MLGWEFLFQQHLGGCWVGRWHRVEWFAAIHEKPYPAFVPEACRGKVITIVSVILKQFDAFSVSALYKGYVATMFLHCIDLILNHFWCISHLQAPILARRKPVDWNALAMVTAH